MAETLQVGIVGTGGIAQSHLQAISQIPNIKVAAVMDLDVARAQQEAKPFGARVYTRYEDLLANDEVQAVLICTPHNVHADQAVAAAKAGKHVLVEKPMALTVADCDRMIDASEAAGRVLMVGQVLRYWPVNRKAKELIKAGTIGRVGHMMRSRHAHFRPQGGINGAPWYADLEVGGVCALYCFGPHEFDILPWLIDSPVVKVYSQGSESSDFYAGQYDSYTTVMNHANGAVSLLSQSLSLHSGSWEQQIVGSLGSIRLTSKEVYVNGQSIPYEGETRDGMVAQLKEFAQCCLTGETPDASGRSVRHTMAVIEAAKVSAERGEPVYLREFDRPEAVTAC